MLELGGQLGVDPLDRLADVIDVVAITFAFASAAMLAGAGVTAKSREYASTLLADANR